MSLRWLAWRCLVLLPAALACAAQGEVVLHCCAAEDKKPAALIPHAQDRPPGPALSPAEAIAQMTVPEGFTVELVASEPDLVNPVAMTVDERGRFWVTESFEYPRREAGPGRDRIKVLEDTDGDGQADRVTIFAEGLNIPSGIAVGHGGVWVANAPDILFLQDTDGDGRADKQEVVVTGFGRLDTHELPNSLTWGPDGYLYGLNGVFNPSRVEQDGRVYEFTCALFRIHPRTRRFELFCEGTSNPWGVAFDTDGSAFISACVIDHLWHLTETGYYHRQGGAYPPFVWKLGSIVKHKHQKAAYCGIHFFDSDAYPPEYRQRFYMGNIHGGCLNVDVPERDGATYFAKPADDFLTANDAWFMPVVQKTGPDGSLYVLDWYDRYHCYQDANRDPAGIDRLKGRLYRIRYGQTPRRWNFDFSQASTAELIRQLGSGNGYERDIAQRLLSERLLDSPDAKLLAQLRQVALGNEGSLVARRHALFVLASVGALVDHAALSHEDAWVRAWGVRTAGNVGQVAETLRAEIAALARDPSPDVRLQVAIAARKIAGLDAIAVLSAVLAHSGDDKLLPKIVWQNLHPLLEDQADAYLSRLEQLDPTQVPALTEMLPLLVERIAARKSASEGELARLLTLGLRNAADASQARACLVMLAKKAQTGEIAGPRLTALKQKLEGPLDEIVVAGAKHPLHLDVALLISSWGDPRGAAAVRAALADADVPEARRIQACEALVAARDAELPALVREVLATPDRPGSHLVAGVLGALSRAEEPAIAAAIVAQYPRLAADLQPRAIELLTGRASWARPLLAAIGAKQLPAEALNVNQVRKLLATGDKQLIEQVQATWGVLREERSPEREALIAKMRDQLRQASGDPQAGQAVFKKVCGQCHKIYGEGQEVGPDITLNGRASFAQLLSNVFDPSLVIGAAYQSRTLQTTDGRVLIGLPVEENDQRVVLKVQGGKLETIPRDQIEDLAVNPLSMMPEGLEKQLQPQELSDLFAFITLDRPPTDPMARFIPGVKELQPRTASDPGEFAAILAEVAPGFSTAASGEQGVGLLAEYRGRPVVVRTHPVNEETPCVLQRTMTIPAQGKTWLRLAVAHDPRGDWQLVVRANGQKLHDSVVGEKTTRNGWVEHRIDLSPLAGKQVDLRIENRANGWSWEFAYWGKIEITNE